MRRKLRGLIAFLLAYVSVIFFSFDIPRRFPNRSEAQIPHVFNAASPPQFSRSPSPFMPPFGVYYPPMMAPIPVPPGPSELSSDQSPNSEVSKRTRVDWTRDETSILLEIWGAIYDSLKSASTAQKKSLWSQILKKFQDKCFDMGVSSNKNLDQLKKRIKNLEYEYLQVRTKMASTGEEGAKKLESNCAFYEELDDIQGTRDAVNPDRMTISSSKVIPKKKSPSAGPLSKEGEKSSSSASSDSQQPSTSSASDESPLQQVPPKTKGKAAKRKRKEPNDEDEDPYMKGICDMWRISMEKQAKRFNHSMELQQAAIRSQTEQTKALVSGLKDILKDCLQK